jgi:Retrotransposon gag protein
MFTTRAQGPIELWATQPFKLKELDTFHRDQKKLQAFLTQVKLNIILNQEKFDIKEKRVMYISTYLRDRAFDWFEPKLTDYLNNPSTQREDETTRVFRQFTVFKEEIKKVFKSINETRIAKQNMKNLRQTGSATKYLAEFQQIASRLK